MAKGPRFFLTYSVLSASRGSSRSRNLSPRPASRLFAALLTATATHRRTLAEGPLTHCRHRLYTSSKWDASNSRSSQAASSRRSQLSSSASPRTRFPTSEGRSAYTLTSRPTASLVLSPSSKSRTAHDRRPFGSAAAWFKSSTARRISARPGRRRFPLCE
jgi:hypothetical protein